MNLTQSLLHEAEQARANRDWIQADRRFLAAAHASDNADAAFAAGCHFAEREQFGVAVVQFMRAFDAAQLDGDVRRQAVICRNLAAVYRELGDADLARRFQRRSLALDDSAGPEELLDWSAEVLVAGKLALADQLAEEAGLMVDDVGVQADAYGQRGIVAARGGQLRLAVRLLIRAARGHQHVGDDRGLAADYQNLAEVCGMLDRFVWQRCFFEAARQCFDRAGMMRSESRAALRLRQVERVELCRTAAAWN